MSPWLPSAPIQWEGIKLSPPALWLVYGQSQIQHSGYEIQISGPSMTYYIPCLGVVVGKMVVRYLARGTKPLPGFRVCRHPRCAAAAKKALPPITVAQRAEARSSLRQIVKELAE